MSECRAVEVFGKALSKLREFAETPIVNDRDRAGIIQAFEFTFEQCWKAFQCMAEEQGLAVASPRQALQAACQLGFFAADDEEPWLGMLRDRNMTSHLYQDELAREIAERVVAVYLPLLTNVQGKLL